MYRRWKCLTGSVPDNQSYPHAFTIHIPVSQSSTHLFPCHRLCAFVSLNNSVFIVVTIVQFLYFYLKKCVWCFSFLVLPAVIERSLNIHWVHNLQNVFVCICGCVGLCMCMWIRLHECISALPLKHCVEVFEAHGSSYCVPSYCPASVSTWPRAGCSPEVLPQPENQPDCPASSGCFASSDCS